MSLTLRPTCYGFKWGSMLVQRMASLAREGHGWYTVLGVGTEKAPYRIQITMTKSGRLTVVVDQKVVFDESGRHPKGGNRPDWDTPGSAGPLPLIPDPRIVRLGGGDGLIPTPKPAVNSFGYAVKPKWEEGAIGFVGYPRVLPTAEPPAQLMGLSEE